MERELRGISDDWAALVATPLTGTYATIQKLP